MSDFCNQSIPADTDIGGPGVMGAFLAMAWITVSVSCVAKSPQINIPSRFRELSWPNWCIPSEGFIEKSGDLLGPLADIQAITGLAIVIAGFKKLNTMSFYHMDHVNYYWTITLTSFWAAQTAVGDPESDWDPYILLVRRVAILAATITGVAFQFTTLNKEDHEWDDEVSGNCYRVGDPTDTIGFARFWMAGAIVFSLALVLLTFGLGKYLVRLQELLLRGENTSLSVLHNVCDNSKGHQSKPFASNMFRQTYLAIILVLWALLTFSYFLFVTLFAVWGGIHTEHASMFLLIVIASQIWNTYGLTALRASNRPLIEEEETLYGFGQVLPLVIMLQIVFSAVDIWRRKKI